MEEHLTDRPRQVADTVVAGTVALVTMVDVLIVARYGGEGDWWFEAVVGGAVWVLVLLRGRSPGLAATAGIALVGVATIIAAVNSLPSQPGLGPTAGLFVLGATCFRLSVPATSFVVGLGGLVLLVAGHVGLRSNTLLALALAGSLAWVGAAAVGLWLRSADAHRGAILATAREEERLALARELHDVVGHHLVGILVQTQATRLVTSANPARDPHELSRDLADIEASAATAMTAMRRIVGLLRGDVNPSGREQVEALVAQFERHGPTVALEVPDDMYTWPGEVATTVTRIVQESLTNISLHATGVSAVAVTIHAEPTAVHVEVIDDAPLAPPSRTPAATARLGYGIAGLHERVAALGGHFTAQPRPDRGWAVCADLPLTSGER